MSDNKRDKIVAFVCGDLIVTAMNILGIFGDLGHFGLKVLATIILGAAGGIAGMIGKDVYAWWKNRKNKSK
jgi:hypothetical protein